MRLIQSFLPEYPIAFELSQIEQDEADESGVYEEWCRAVLGKEGYRWLHREPNFIMFTSVDAAFKYKLRWELEESHEELVEF